MVHTERAAPCPTPLGSWAFLYPYPGLVSVMLGGLGSGHFNEHVVARWLRESRVDL